MFCYNRTVNFKQLRYGFLRQPDITVLNSNFYCICSAIFGKYQKINSTVSDLHSSVRHRLTPESYRESRSVTHSRIFPASFSHSGDRRVSANFLKDAAKARRKVFRNSIRSLSRSSGFISSPSGSFIPPKTKLSASKVPVQTLFSCSR